MERTTKSRTPKKNSTAQYNYEFSGWNPTLTVVTGEQNYTATYNGVLRSYQVTFFAEDGTTVLQRTNVEYGSTPAYEGETPVHFLPGG